MPSVSEILANYKLKRIRQQADDSLPDQPGSRGHTPRPVAYHRTASADPTMARGPELQRRASGARGRAAGEHAGETNWLSARC
jgi:hypothetical protein